MVQTRWRAAAEWRRRRTERRPAEASTTVDLRAREMGSILASFFFGVFDEGGHAVEVVLGEFGGGEVEESGDDLGGGVAEERIEKVTEGGVFGLGGGEAGSEDVFEAFDAVGDVAFGFEGFEKGADGGIRGGIGEGGEDVSGGGGTALVENVHDLALAPTERLLFF